MWKYGYTLETVAEPEKLWKLYSDVNSWPKWDRGIKDVTLEGTFSTGTHGKIKPSNQDWLEFTLTKVEPLMGFSDRTEIPGTDSTICFDHTITSLPSGKTRIRHEVIITGENSELIGKEIGPSLVSGIPEAMENIASLALATE